MPTSICTDTLSHPHYPSPRTKLASLVKGRWIDGKTQALILLLSVCDTSAFFIHQIFLPSRRRDCHTNLSKTALSNPLFVGRGACPSRCTEPLYPHDHCKRTIIPRSHQPLSKPHYPSKSPPPLPLNERSGSAILQKRTIGSLLS